MDGAPRIAIPVHYDFASSLCYVAHRSLQRLQPDLDALGIELHWTPIDLARLLGWRRGAQIPAVRRENALRVARELEVELRVPTTWPDSRSAMAAAIALEQSPRAATWRERVWSALFEEGRSLDSATDVAALARQLDLAIDAASDALAHELAELEARTRAAAEAEVTGVPTFMLGRWPFGGIQSDDTMRHVLRRYVERREERRGKQQG